MELSQKNEDLSTEFLSFKFRSDNISQLQSNIIYATTLKSKGTQTDFPNLVNAIDNNNNNNCCNNNDLHSSIEYKEIIRNDPPEIGVTIGKKIVKPPRKHPPSQAKAQLSFVINCDDKIDDNCDLKDKFYNSLYPEVKIVQHEDSKSFKSVLDRNDGNNEENLSEISGRKLSSLELMNSIEIESKKPKLVTSFIKKCRRMLNFNDFDLNIESERKSPLKSWSSITSALGSQPAGHSTLIDINLSGVAAGGQDEDYNSPKQQKSNEKKINFDSVVKSKNLVVEMNSKERPESRIIDDDDDHHFCQYCKDADFYSDLSVDKNKNYSSKESSRITGFGKDLHQFLRDVKSIFKIQHNYHNSEDNDDDIGWVKMSTLKRNTSVTLFNKINHNKGCYSFL